MSTWPPPCDGCGVPARWYAGHPSGLALTFCSHHVREHAIALLAARRRDGDFVSVLLSQERLTQWRGDRDQILRRIGFKCAHQLDRKLFLEFQLEQLNRAAQLRSAIFGPLDDLRQLQSLLELSDAGLKPGLVEFCLVVRRVLTQVTVRLGFAYSLGNTHARGSFEIFKLGFELCVSFFAQQDLVGHGSQVL